MRHIFAITTMFVVLVSLFSFSSPRTRASSSQPTTVGFWGMNTYLTKRERLTARDNLALLADTAREAGVQWTREELPWDLIEQRPGRRTGVYDSSLKLAADKGFGIIGMLLTTPSWARDPSCRPAGPAYWCPPSDVNLFASWAGWMAERYDGDGTQDALDSPRIAAWEIWNEPNDTLLWPNVGADDNVRKRRYGELLVAAYDAIKAADPSALVLTGGSYIYDGSCAGGICDGLNFFNAEAGVFPQVPAAREKFDVFAIHPFIPTDRPDAPQIPRTITVEGRIRNTRTWLNRDIGRANAPIWITEIGWCTSGGTCPGGVAVEEDAQANFLVRSLVTAQQTGVAHASWFQFEDAFDDPNREWANADMLHDYADGSYAPKPAYQAYRALAAQLKDAQPVGVGPVNTHVYDLIVSQDRGDNGTYNFRYTRGTTLIDVLWVPEGTRQVTFPLDPTKQTTMLDRDGGELLTSLGTATLSLKLDERPIFVIQASPVEVERPYKVLLPVVAR